MAEDVNWAAHYFGAADIYHELVVHEDFRSNLLPAIMEIAPIKDALVAEFGAGTGRVTGLLAPYARLIICNDLSPVMLKTGRQSLRKMGHDNWRQVISDSRQAPLADASADIAIQGWSYLHLAISCPDTWKTEIDLAISEMMRVLRPGGYAILIETLGTGEYEPNISEAFRQVYDYWEKKWGFSPTWLRTDYLFDSIKQASRILTPFFGAEMLERCSRSSSGWVLPECTGIWHRREYYSG